MRKKHLRVLKQIQDGIPQELLKNLTKIELQAPTMKKVFEMALEDPKTTPRQKRNIQAMLDSGKLDRKVEVLDHEVEKQIDAYFEEEIAKAVKLGRLPKEAEKLESLKNKGNQYARRQEKRLRTLFTGEASDVDGTEEEDQNHQDQHQKPQIADPSVSVTNNTSQL